MLSAGKLLDHQKFLGSIGAFFDIFCPILGIALNSIENIAMTMFFHKKVASPDNKKITVNTSSRGENKKIKLKLLLKDWFFESFLT